MPGRVWITLPQGPGSPWDPPGLLSQGGHAAQHGQRRGGTRRAGRVSGQHGHGHERGGHDQRGQVRRADEQARDIEEHAREKRHAIRVRHQADCGTRRLRCQAGDRRQQPVNVGLVVVVDQPGAHSAAGLAQAENPG